MSYYGFDSFESPPRVYTSEAYGMMTYCFARYWMSDYSYLKLQGENPNSTNQFSLSGNFSTGQPWLIASGIITPTTNIAEPLPFYVLPDLESTYNPQSGDYSIELYDAGDTLLVSHPFTLTHTTTSPPLDPQADSSDLFMEVLPYDSSTAYILWFSLTGYELGMKNRV